MKIQPRLNWLQTVAWAKWPNQIIRHEKICKYLNNAWRHYLGGNCGNFFSKEQERRKLGWTSTAFVMDSQKYLLDLYYRGVNF